MTLQTDLEKSIALLAHALEASGVPSSRYALPGHDPDEVLEDRLVLEQADDAAWTVYYVERGERTQTARFDRYQDATKYVFWSLTSAPSQWAFRVAWEQETGITF